MIPLFQSHGIGSSRPDRLCRTNHCGRGSDPETMPPPEAAPLSNQSIPILTSPARNHHDTSKTDWIFVDQ